MSNNFIELDDCATRLECLADTFTTVVAAMREGSSYVPKNALFEPVNTMNELTKKLSSLVQAIFDEQKQLKAKGGKTA